MDDLSTEAAKQALQPIGDMLRKIAGPLADEMGESLGVVARHYRYRLAVKMYQKTERMLTDAGRRTVQPWIETITWDSC